MRFLNLFFIMTLAAACGKSGGSGGNGLQAQSAEQPCAVNGVEVSCDSLRNADGQGVDDLTAKIDVPAKITASEITFMANKAAADEGRRTKCSVSVKQGEVYQYSISGDTLELFTSAGEKLSMNRISGSGNMGTFTQHSYGTDGAKLLKQVHINTDRVILTNKCEL